MRFHASGSRISAIFCIFNRSRRSVPGRRRPIHIAAYRRPKLVLHCRRRIGIHIARNLSTGANPAGIFHI
jgi:hypothetical protein